MSAQTVATTSPEKRASRRISVAHSPMTHRPAPATVPILIDTERTSFAQAHTPDGGHGDEPDDVEEENHNAAHDARGEARRAANARRKGEPAAWRWHGEDPDPGADAAQAVGHRREREADGMTDRRAMAARAWAPARSTAMTREAKRRRRRTRGGRGEPAAWRWHGRGPRSGRRCGAGRRPSSRARGGWHDRPSAMAARAWAPARSTAMTRERSGAGGEREAEGASQQAWRWHGRGPRSGRRCGAGRRPSSRARGGWHDRPVGPWPRRAWAPARSTRHRARRPSQRRHDGPDGHPAEDDRQCDPSQDPDRERVRDRGSSVGFNGGLRLSC